MSNFINCSLIILFTVILTGCATPQIGQHTNWLYVQYRIIDCGNGSKVTFKDKYNDSNGNKLSLDRTIKNKSPYPLYLYNINRDSFLGASTLWQSISIQRVSECSYLFSALLSNSVSFSSKAKDKCKDVNSKSCQEGLKQAEDKLRVASSMFFKNNNGKGLRYHRDASAVKEINR